MTLLEQIDKLIAGKISGLVIISRSKTDTDIERQAIDTLESRGIILESKPNNFSLLPEAYIIHNSGGWDAYNQKKEAERLTIQERQQYKDQLETEKTEREIEKLKYEQSIRELDNEIKQLTKVNYTLQNAEIIYRWIVAAVGVFGGLFLEHSLGIVQWLIKHLVL